MSRRQTRTVTSRRRRPISGLALVGAFVAATAVAAPAAAAPNSPQLLCQGLKGAANQYCQQLPGPGGPVPSGPGAGPGSFFPPVSKHKVAKAAAATIAHAPQVAPHGRERASLPGSLFTGFPGSPLDDSGGGVDPLIALLAALLLAALLAAIAIAARRRYRDRAALAGSGDTLGLPQ